MRVEASQPEFAKRVDVGHAATPASGTAALHLALLLVGVERGNRARGHNRERPR